VARVAPTRQAASRAANMIRSKAIDSLWRQEPRPSSQRGGAVLRTTVGLAAMASP
jgi:hypothetical protein